MDLKARIAEQAKSLGFAAIGVCAPDAIPEAPARLDAFLDDGHHGAMGWMEDRKTWRADPGALWPEARSVIMLLENYAPDHDPLADLTHRDRGVISSYAGNEDYHDVVKKRLKTLGRWLIEQEGGQIKVFVDTAPVMEKPLAAAAGLGWQGKHTNLLSREFGNWVFIGSVFTTLEIEPDAPEVDHCGSCTSCLDICPTEAFPAPRRLDARKCISYLTIEHKGPVDPELRPKLGNRIYGCDDCLAVCPWNKFAQEAREVKYHMRAENHLPALRELAGLDDTDFRARFRKSPIKRIGRDRFVRNVLYAIGNSGDVGLRDVAFGLTQDTDPVVADAAEWAVARLEGRL